jgi:hypothetical protein
LHPHSLACQILPLLCKVDTVDDGDLCRVMSLLVDNGDRDKVKALVEVLSGPTYTKGRSGAKILKTILDYYIILKGDLPAASNLAETNALIFSGFLASAICLQCIEACASLIAPDDSVWISSAALDFTAEPARQVLITPVSAAVAANPAMFGLIVAYLKRYSMDASQHMQDIRHRDRTTPMPPPSSRLPTRREIQSLVDATGGVLRAAVGAAAPNPFNERDDQSKSSKTEPGKGHVTLRNREGATGVNSLCSMDIQVLYASYLFGIGSSRLVSPFGISRVSVFSFDL